MAKSGTGSEQVLILAPIGRDGPAAAELLRHAGLTSQICLGLAGLRAGLEAGAGVAVIAEEAFYRESIDLITGWVEAQPSWSDFPFIVLSGRASPEMPRRIRLLETLRNVSLLERPLQTVTLASAVQAALRARRRQYETRCYLVEREQAASQLERLVAERTGELEEANRRLRAEIAERAQVEAALRQAQKMEAVGQLTGGVAHDFNNLLTAVLGNLDLAIAQVTTDKVRRLLSNAERAARRGARLTQQLLAFSRKQQLNPQAVDLNALVTSMGDLLVRTMGGTVRIETVLDGDLWPVMVDASQVELVILNLAINGRDAMSGGGRLTVATANVGADAGRRPPELAPGDYVAVSVGDTGTGMTEEVRAKAFEPFFTTKDIGQGTGLGLSQVYGVARQSGGTVRIDTELGRGSTITVYVPRAAAPAAVRSPGAPARAPSRHDHGAILVVDDDADVREMVAAVLHDLGYAVSAAESGRAALDILDRGSRIDLVLVDYAMPELTGIDAARLMRATRPGLRIVVMTGYASTAELGGEAGPERILKKPFSRIELEAAIEGALRGNGAAPSSSPNVVPIRPSSRSK